MPRRLSVPTTPEKNVLGPLLQQARDAVGMTRKQLAESLQRKGWDAAPATINHIENQLRSLTDVELKMIIAVLTLKAPASPAKPISALLELKRVLEAAGKLK